MGRQKEDKPTKKYQATFKYAIIVISLNLFIVGLFACILYLSNSTINKLKKDIDIELILQNSLDSKSINQVNTVLKSKAYVATIKYRSKEVAAKLYEKEIGHNFTEILGYNPMYDAYIINLKPEYLDSKKLKEVKSDLLSVNAIKDVSYSEPISNFVSNSMKPVLIIVIAISSILFFVAFSVIDTTIRLQMYSQRFAIRTKQLIGSTEWFIIKPYIFSSIAVAILSAFTSIAFLGGLVGYFVYKYSLGFHQTDIVFLILLASSLLFISLFMSTISTYFAVKKYLNLNLDDLV